MREKGRRKKTPPTCTYWVLPSKCFAEVRPDWNCMRWRWCVPHQQAVNNPSKLRQRPLLKSRQLVPRTAIPHSLHFFPLHLSPPSILLSFIIVKGWILTSSDFAAAHITIFPPVCLTPSPRASCISTPRESPPAVKVRICYLTYKHPPCKRSQ